MSFWRNMGLKTLSGVPSPGANLQRSEPAQPAVGTRRRSLGTGTGAMGMPWLSIMMPGEFCAITGLRISKAISYATSRSVVPAGTSVRLLTSMGRASCGATTQEPTPFVPSSDEKAPASGPASVMLPCCRSPANVVTEHAPCRLLTTIVVHSLGIGTLVAIVMVRMLAAPGHGSVCPICICAVLKCGAITCSGSLVTLTCGTTVPKPGRAASQAACVDCVVSTSSARWNMYLPCISSLSVAPVVRDVIWFFTVKRNTSRSQEPDGAAAARSNTSTPAAFEKLALTPEAEGKSIVTGSSVRSASPSMAMAPMLVMVPVRPLIVAVGAQRDSGTLDAMRTSSSFSEHGKKFFCSTYEMCSTGATTISAPAPPARSSRAPANAGASPGGMIEELNAPQRP
mmetsp:Transcript_41591/g.98629  ORF Transcript_41591/g.98629 Transcript_41591/m.98629 type:complete len:397 (+) Transcript_41591:5587-6777(+)